MSVQQEEKKAKKSSAATLTLRVLFLLFTDLPKFTQAPTSTTVDITKQVVLTCRSVAKETPRITWYKVDQDGTPTKVPEANILSSGDMQIKNTERSDRSNYFCRACNAAGCAQTSQVMLNVLCKYLTVVGFFNYS